MNNENKQQLKAWFGQCIEENMGSLYAMALRLTCNRADAEDLVAEAVTKAWVSIETLEDRSRFRPWIFCIQRNLFYSNCRKKKIRPKESCYEESPATGSGSEIATLLIEQPDEFLNWWASPEREYSNSLLGDTIKQAIEKLPEVFRETVILVNVEGLSYDEAAQALNVSPGTIRSRMNRGRTLLQKALWQHANESGLVTDKTMMASNT